MGILLQIAFQGVTAGEVVARRDDDGNYLAREISTDGLVVYRKIRVPPLPSDVMTEGTGQSIQKPVSDYVQLSDDVFVDLSCFHPLMHINLLMVYAYSARQGIARVELVLNFPRMYADKIERQMELYKGNLTAVTQKLVAEDIFFQSDNEILSFDISDIEIWEKNESYCEFRLKLQSQSRLTVKTRRLNRLMQAEDLVCTFILDKSRRDFNLGSQQEDTKKGHQI